MYIKLKSWIVGLVLIIFVSLFVFTLFVNPLKLTNKKVDEKLISNEVFKIRIIQESVFFMQFQYKFQTAKLTSNEWKTIKTIVQDDSFPLQAIPMGFIKKDIGYIAFGKIYAVTKDSGETWNFFDYTKQTQFGKENGFVSIIEDVKFVEDGSGTMYLEKNNIMKKPPTLITDDFGISWEEQESK